MEIFPCAETGQWAVLKKLNIAVSILFAHNGLLSTAILVTQPKSDWGPNNRKIPFVCRARPEGNKAKTQTRNSFFFFFFFSYQNVLITKVWSVVQIELCFVCKRIHAH